MIPRLLDRYRNEIVPDMMKRFNFKNPYRVPRLTKIVVNVGLGEAVQDKRLLDNVAEGLAMITGQRPAVTRAKKAIAGFKIKKGALVGCKVTLRRARMYEFLDRLINIAIPRIRDFRGLNPNSFDEHGNYTFGITEQVIFPEIDMDKVQIIHGMDITIASSARNKEEGFELLRLFGMPFRR